MDPVTAGMNLITSINTLIGKIIEKAPPEEVGQIIAKHEARIDRVEAWMVSKFHWLQVDGK